MPRIDIILFAEKDGTCPLLEWMDHLPPKAQDKCYVKVERLAEKGHELRRPEADLLRDKIYELRVIHQGIQYRILYFFHEAVCVISHGFIKKQAEVPDTEIDLALKHMYQFAKEPRIHTFEGEGYEKEKEDD